MKFSHPIVAQASALIEQRTGLAVGVQFRHDLAVILSGLAGGDLTAYVRRLRETPETTEVWQALIDALTIGETYFMRDPSHFQLLRSHILPSLMLKRRQQGKLFFNLWSAGCATGEEPYSLAILLQELLPDLPQWTLRLFGTDLNERALAKAARGQYRQWSFRHTDAHFQARYFTTHESYWQLKPEIRTMVTFRHANLLSTPPLPQLDVIFCRNVLIYMDKEHIRKIEDGFFEALSPGGWLFLGQAEAIHTQRERWLAHIFPGVVAYQKPESFTTEIHTYERHTQPPILIETVKGEAVKPPVATYADAVSAVQSDDSETAERLLAELLMQQPAHARAHTLLASLFANRHALPEAHAHLDRALKLDPLLADAHYVRAVLYIEEGDSGLAQKTLQSALYCQQNHVLAAFMLGNLYAQAGDLTRAHKSWEKARRFLATLARDAAVSDLSDMDAAGFESLVSGYME